MTYSLTPSPARGEILLTFLDCPESDQERGAVLAVALRGRWIPAVGGYSLWPSYARKWEPLFISGFAATRRQIAGGFTIWTYGRTPEERLGLAQAVQASRAPRIVVEA